VDQVLDDLPRVRSLGAAHVLRAMRTHSDEQLAVLEQTTPGTPRLLTPLLTRKSWPASALGAHNRRY
jgi:hypothetical protein